MSTLTNSELRERVLQLASLQEPCQLCPRRCLVHRREDRGHCNQPMALQVAAVCAHRGEEPALSGHNGAGTVFVVGCTMLCRFCQNHQISQPGRHQDRRWCCSPTQLARQMIELQQAGCHNIEWVSPTQHLPALVQALRLARIEGLQLPLVFNCNGYQRPEVLSLLDGVVDIYLPDVKYADPALARRLSATPDYVEVNRLALAEMKRQVGQLQLDHDGVARRGLLVRHLVLPGQLDNTRQVLGWIAAELGRDTWVSLMSQYYPAHCTVGENTSLGRRLTAREYDRALQALEQARLDSGWVQERATGTTFCPDFTRSDPFEARP